MNGMGKTDIGTIRDNNEDSIFVSNEPIGSLENLYIVSDGMGGHNAGEVASQKGIEFFCEYITNNTCLSDNDILDYLIEGVNYANQRVFEISLNNIEMSGMGATFSACTIMNGKIYIAHIGDSRIYISDSQKMTQLTVDHTYVNEMIKAGELTPEEAKKHRLKNIITRALGSEELSRVDANVMELNGYEFILVCSDGLTNMLSDNEIHEILTSNEEVSKKVENLIDLAKEKGGFDNISAILININSNNWEVER